MIYITNALSMSMFSYTEHMLDMRPIQRVDVCALLSDDTFVSAITNSELSSVISNHLGIRCPWRLYSVRLTIQDVLIIATYHGDHLPEGATELPNGATIDYWQITLNW